ncbi:hypothetical protein NADFUDRAFT_46607 [Nadsonia fulvescens var. elongata DSM 6958]|uniref:Uncharacterized protein n=1 Tax=Nadsonia fulvescens var. elongata DSM 6958 TaxID=857566 RepID=A0A1E3PLJ7_9ASCO|nr:hypothetical protein NADFUDRAFT_46607 [Nadsonia fulvescens var. elongata DSM 6958]
MSLSELISRKLHILAAERARDEIISYRSQNETGLFSISECIEIFNLWYIRLTCLVRTRYAKVFHEEARQLGDLSSEYLRIKGDPKARETGTSIVPWSLRIFVVKLQANGDSQAGIARFYALAREARIESWKAKETKIHSIPIEEDNSREICVSSEIWDGRLRKLGVYIAATLIGMHDYTAAISLLRQMYETLQDKINNMGEGTTDEIESNKAFLYEITQIIGLTYLTIGDTLSAREWFNGMPQSANTRLNLAICSMADEDWAAAETALTLSDEEVGELLSERGESHVSQSKLLLAEFINNMSIVKLHQGHVDQSLELLGSIIEKGIVISNIIFNISTLLELQHENSSLAKAKLMLKVRENGAIAMPTYSCFKTA